MSRHAHAFVVLVTVSLTLAGGCRARAPREEPREAPTVRIGTFVEGGSTRIANLLSSEFLVTVGWDGRPVFRLAESATESADGLALTIRLRSNARFHSGQLLTARRVRDVLLERAAVSAAVAEIEESDERTLVLRLRRPHALHLVDLSEHAVQEEDDSTERAGPFKVVSLSRPAVLAPFDHYYQGVPSVGRVEIEEYASHRAAWTAMMRGEINFLHEVSREAIDFMQAGGDITAYPLLRPYYVTLVFNQRHPILGRLDVRLAMSEAIDRAELLRLGMRGQGEAAFTPFWPHHWAHPALHPPVHNPDAARIRLDTGGLPVRSSPSAMPARFAFTCLVHEGDARFERLALVLQRQLSAIGIDMRLHPVPQQELGDRIAAGRYDTYLFELVNGRTLSFPYQFWHSRTSPLATGYSAADAALDSLQTATTEHGVRAAVTDVMRVMRNDPPAVFLVWPREARAADNAIALPYEQDRDVFGTLWRARSRAVREPSP